MKRQRIISGSGYVCVWMPDHPRAKVAGGYVAEHILIAEAALGKFIPRSVQIHHFNGDTLDNRPENLVVCEDIRYHWLLHRRQRALAACGNPNWSKCTFCKKYDAPENLKLYGSKSGSQARHLECLAAYERGRYRNARQIPPEKWRPKRIETTRRRSAARAAMEEKRRAE